MIDPTDVGQRSDFYPAGLFPLTEAEHLHKLAKAVGQRHESAELDQLFVTEVPPPALEVTVGDAAVVLREPGGHVEGRALALVEDGIVDVPRRLDLVVDARFRRTGGANGASVTAVARASHPDPHQFLDPVRDQRGDVEAPIQAS